MAAAITMAAAVTMATVATAAAARARTAIRSRAAIAAIARRMATMAATATEQAGFGLILTAHKGDPNQREKDRDTENNDTVHPRILQLLTGTGKRENTQDAVTCFCLAARVGVREKRTLRSLRETAPSISQPLSSFEGYEGCGDRTG
ncbi:MAG TPA: hypothetical protein VFV87_01045 [Pirellulaceae bacterium]|nr:hypothetical protein [Pirellulaceae bacterium]